MVDDDDLLLITNGGTMVRTPCQDISILGRNTQGVTLIRLTEGEQLVRVDAVAEPSVDMGSETDLAAEAEALIDESDETGDESADYFVLDPRLYRYQFSTESAWSFMTFRAQISVMEQSHREPRGVGFLKNLRRD